MARELLPAFDREAFLNGSMTPIWFGSAINSFGVKELMDGIGEYGPPPQTQKAAERQIAPEEERRDRLCLQGAGQHGPQAPRPGGLCAPRLGAFHRAA